MTTTDVKLFKDLEPVAGMVLVTDHTYTVRLTKPALHPSNKGTWDSVIIASPHDWTTGMTWYMFPDMPATVVPDPDTIPQPQEEVKLVSWEMHEQRARQLMRESYKRGKRDGFYKAIAVLKELSYDGRLSISYDQAVEEIMSLMEAS